MSVERHKILDHRVTNHLASLRESKNSLGKFDTSVQSFLAWLSETESSIESIEDDDEDDHDFSKKLDEIKGEMAERDREFSSLMTSGETMIRGMTSSDDTIMLRLRTQEMNSRMKDLQNKILNLSDRVKTEDVVSNHRSWIRSKETELKSQRSKIAHDVTGIKRQLDEHIVFR